MANHRARQLDPWRAAFVCGCVAFVASLVIFAVVLQAALSGGGETTRAAEPGPTAAAGESEPPPGAIAKGLTYTGVLPASLASAGLDPAAPDAKPDISFDPDPAATLVPTTFFVPVAALGTGIDNLTRAQLDDVLAGRVTDWASVGGVSGKVVVASGPADDALAIQALFPSMAPTLSFATYDDLRAAMALDSGMIAVVPLAEVRVSMSAVGVDGVDIVRGLGDVGLWPFVGITPVRATSNDGKDALASLVASMTTAPPKVTRVIATGDILQSRCSLAAIEASGDWASALRGEMADYLAGADLTLGSLDGSIQDINAPYLCVAQEYPVLTSPPEVMAALTLAGFDEMTVATNHVFDCGLEPCGNRAFLQTLDRLSAAGIKTVGGGRNLDEALAPAIFEINGVKFGVLGFDDIAAEDLEATDTDPGTAPMDDSYADEKAALPAEPAFYKPPKCSRLAGWSQPSAPSSSRSMSSSSRFRVASRTRTMRALEASRGSVPRLTPAPTWSSGTRATTSKRSRFGAIASSPTPSVTSSSTSSTPWPRLEGYVLEAELLGQAAGQRSPPPLRNRGPLPPDLRQTGPRARRFSATSSPLPQTFRRHRV